MLSYGLITNRNCSVEDHWNWINKSTTQQLEFKQVVKIFCFWQDLNKCSENNISWGFCFCFFLTISVNQLLQVQENVHEVLEKLFVVNFSCGINATNLQFSNFCLHGCYFSCKEFREKAVNQFITSKSQNNAVKNKSWFIVQISLAKCRKYFR